LTGQLIPEHQLNQHEYTLQRVVESFGNLLFEFAEQHLTHTYQVVFQFCELKNIGYLVLRCLKTIAKQYKEFCEEWLHDWELYSSYTLKKGFCIGSIWKLLLDGRKH